MTKKFDFFNYLNIATEGVGYVFLVVLKAIALTVGLPFFLIGLWKRYSINTLGTNPSIGDGQ